MYTDTHLNNQLCNAVLPVILLWYCYYFLICLQLVCHIIITFVSDILLTI